MEPEQPALNIRSKGIEIVLPNRFASIQDQIPNYSGLTQSATLPVNEWRAKDRYFYKKQKNLQKTTVLSVNKIRVNNSTYQCKNVKMVKNENRKFDEVKEFEDRIQVPHFSMHSHTNSKQVNPVESEKKFYVETIMAMNQNFGLETPKKLIRPLSMQKSRIDSRASAREKRYEEKQRKIKFGSYATNAEQIIKKHKASNVKSIEQKLRLTMNRAGTAADQNRLKSMREYNRKCGYPEDSKIFIWNSEDEYIKRILLSWGWIHNQSHQSPFFHLKWTYNPSFAEQKVKEPQFSNHFKNSHEITSKSYLSKNLKTNQSSFGKIDTYYPKCFDIGNSSEQLQFMDEFRRNIMMILLTKVYHYFCLKRPEKVRELDLYYCYHYDKNLFKSLQNVGRNKKTSMLRNKKFRKIEFQDYKRRDHDFIVHLNLIVQALRYWRHYRKNSEQQLDREFHFLNFNSADFIRHFSTMEKYAKFQEISKPKDEIDFCEEMFGTPSELLIARVVKEYHFWEKTGSIIDSYGEDNIWIIKPSSTSRGSGIFLTTDIETVLSSSKQIQSRIAQKYIEKPLMLKGELAGRKFDIRQWVLVKSINPLQIYMFSECYLRVCYGKYDHTDLTDLSCHLTNYSVNKAKFREKEDSVLPLCYLENLLEKDYRVNWEKDIKPKVKDIITRSFKSCMQNLDDSNSSCFQLLGYDILIDEKVRISHTQFNPWLLEVNMSPACEERTPWLSQYLHQMGTKLLKEVLPLDLAPSFIDYQQTIDLERECKWELILYENYFFNKKKDADLALEVTGTMVSLNNQREVDRLFLKNQKAMVIQKFFKKYLPKYKSYKQQKKRNEVFIRLFFSTFLEQKIYATKLKERKTETMNKYLKSLKDQTQCKNLLRNQSKNKINQYLKQWSQNGMYERQKESYQRKIMIEMGQIVALKKKLQCMVQQINQKGEKIIFIQIKYRQYLAFKKEKKKLLQPYLTAIFAHKELEERKKQIEKRKWIKTLKTYFAPIFISKKVQQTIRKAKIDQISKYIGSLKNRNEFFEKKLAIFFYMTGRVVRVSKRRIRCEYLKQIIEKWSQSKKKKFRSVIQRYMKTYGHLQVEQRKNKVRQNG